MTATKDTDRSPDIERLIEDFSMSVAEYGGEDYWDERLYDAECQFSSYPDEVLLRISRLLSHFSPEARERMIFDFGGKHIPSLEWLTGYLTVLEGVTDLSGHPSLFASAEIVPMFQGLKLMSTVMSEEDKELRASPLPLDTERQIKEQQAVFRFLVLLYGSVPYAQMSLPQYTDSYTGIVLRNPRIYDAILNAPDKVDLMAKMVLRHEVYDVDTITQLVAVAHENSIHSNLDEGCL